MYDQNLALSCAHAAELAYADKSDCPHDIFISAGSTQATVVKRGNLVILAFRGTQPDKIKDWLSDLRFAKVRFSGHMVHKGFYLAYQAIRKQILWQINNLDESAQLHITGHSLGGALATLAAYDLDSLGFKINSVYTFGSPRVGDRRFAAAFNARFEGRSYRIINDSDIVCRVPTMLRWRHVDQPVFFSKDQPPEMIAPPWWYGAGEIWHNVTRFKWGKDFTDHGKENYINLLTTQRS
jgi:triacylglycerol lipase